MIPMPVAAAVATDCLCARQSPPAPEHHALPHGLSLRFKQALGIALAIVSVFVFLGALSLAIWQQVVPINYGNNNTCSL